MPASRQYSASKFLVTLQGAEVGFALSVEGGETFADVIGTPAPSGVVEKHIGQLRAAPIVLEVDTSPKAAFWDWIAAYLARTQTPTSGSIGFLDYNFVERSRLEWTDALMTEVAFPAADGSSRDSARLRVTIQPATTSIVAGSGSSSTGAFGSKSKRWLASNFRFTVSGLDTPLRKTSSVASLVIRQPVTATPVGAGPAAAGGLAAGTLEVPDVVFTIPASEGALIYDWFDDFVVQGNNSTADERDGSFAFVDESRKDDVIGIEMHNLGIFRISDQRVAQGASAIARIQVEMYCERMTLSPSPAHAAAPAPPAPGGPAAPGAPASGVQPPGTPPATRLDPAVAGAILDALVEAAGRSAPPAAIGAGGIRPALLRGDVVAERLLSTAAPAVDDAAPVAGTDVRRERGRKLGTEWAGTTATLDELERVAALDETDWSALALSEGESLIAFLVAQGELREGETGPVDLGRDDFTEGLVAGAAAMRREAAPHLEGRLPPRPVG